VNGKPQSLTSSVPSYFRLEDSVEIKNRWFLRGPRDPSGALLDARELAEGRKFAGTKSIRLSMEDNDQVAEVPFPLQLGIRRTGTSLDFTFADSDVPVVSERVGNILGEIAGTDIQRFPVRIDGVKGKFEIINVVRLIDCIDTKRSRIQWYQPGNDVRPDLAGKPEMITKLRIKSDVVNGSDIFRLSDWKIALIVSDRVRSAFAKAKVSGVSFSQV
jgi:hypothetical protein